MAFKKFGFVQGAVVSRWTEIVGERYAKVSTPESIRFPAGKKSGGTLTLAVDGAHAPLLQHLAPMIMERVNLLLRLPSGGEGRVPPRQPRQGRRQAVASAPPRSRANSARACARSPTPNCAPCSKASPARSPRRTDRRPSCPPPFPSNHAPFGVIRTYEEAQPRRGRQPAGPRHHRLQEASRRPRTTIPPPRPSRRPTATGASSSRRPPKAAC